MIDKDLLLKRKKDGVEVVTLEPEKPIQRRKDPYDRHIRSFVPVRYVKSGRKGYLKADVLEAEFVVTGKFDPKTRWDRRPMIQGPDSAAALEDFRERDLRDLRKKVLQVEMRMPDGRLQLKDLNPSQNALTALDQALHMIMAGV